MKVALITGVTGQDETEACHIRPFQRASGSGDRGTPVEELAGDGSSRRSASGNQDAGGALCSLSPFGRVSRTLASARVCGA